MERLQTESQHVQTNRFLYQIIEQIGKGQEGSVFRAINLTTKQQVALKKQMQTSKHEERVIRLLSTKQLSHVVNILDYCYQGRSLILIMELGENSFDEEIRKQNNEEIIIDYFLQIAQGIEEIHSLGFLHRDIKPANILCTRSQNGKMILKICDTGLMRDASGLKTVNVGTPIYMAPEQILQSQYDEKVDIWSLGLLLYEMFKGWPLFNGQNKEEVFKKIKDATQVQINQSIDQLFKCPSKIKEILIEMINISPKNRLSAKYTLFRFLSPLNIEEIKEQQLREQQEFDKKFEEEKQKLILEFEKNKAKQVEQIKLQMMKHYQEEMNIKLLELEKQKEKEFQEKLKQFEIQTNQLILKEFDDISNSIDQFQGDKSQYNYQNKLQFRKTLSQQVQIEKEAEIQQIEREKTLQIKKKVQEEYQYQIEEQLRKLRVKINEEQQNYFQALKFSVINQMTACKTLINNQITYLSQKEIEINKQNQQYILEAQLKVQTIIKHFMNQLNLIEEDIQQINQLITLKQIQEAQQKYFNKQNEISDQIKQVEEIFQKLKFIRIESNDEKQQQLKSLQQQYQNQQTGCQNYQNQIELFLKKCDDKIRQSSYATNEMREELGTIKLRYTNLKVKNREQNNLQINFLSISDQVQFKMWQLTQLDDQIKQFGEILANLKNLEFNYEKLIQKVIEEAENQKFILLSETEKRIRNIKVFYDLQKEDYPANIMKLFDQIKNQILLLEAQMTEIQDLKFLKNESDEIIFQQSSKLFENRVQIDNLYCQTDKIICILQEAIFNYIEYYQVQDLKLQQQAELLEELCFNELIQKLQQQINKISEAIENNEKNQNHLNLSIQIKETNQKLKRVEQTINVFKIKLQEEFSQIVNFQDLSFIRDSYRKIIFNIKQKLIEQQTEIEQLEAQINKVSQNILSQAQSEVFHRCVQIQELLNKRISKTKSNMYFQQALLQSNFKGILLLIPAMGQIIYLKKKREEFLEYQDQAKENLELSASIDYYCSNIQRRLQIYNSEIISHTNDLNQLISYCNQGIEIGNSQKLENLGIGITKFEQKLDCEKRQLFTYQKQLNRIRIIQNNQQKEDTKETLSELDQIIQINQSQQFLEIYNFNEEWNQIIEEFQLEFKCSVQIKCIAILVRLHELKKFILRQLNVKKKQSSQANQVNEIHYFVQEHLGYYNQYLSNIQASNFNRVNEQCFFTKYSTIEAQSVEYFNWMMSRIKGQNQARLNATLKEQYKVTYILKNLMPNLEGNKIKIFLLTMTNWKN